MHPAEQYAKDVTTGKIPACHWIRRACARYFDDKKHAKERGLVFNKEQAQLAVDFFTVVPLPDGGEYQLENWALFYVWNVFGWYRAKHPRWVIEQNGKLEDTSGTRRFREAYIELARKNIKTSAGSRTALKLAFADGKLDAEVYIAATKRDQARICFNDCRRSVETSEFLREDFGIEVLQHNINQQHTNSKIQALSAKTNSMDGLRAHGVILDEVHAWRDGEAYTKLKRSVSTDPQPLILMITTAGRTEESKFCWTMHEYACKVLDDIVPDDTFFALIYTLDDPDDWENEANYIMANPYLGISKKMDYMRTEAERARNDPLQLNKFKQYDLNIWVRSDAKWMPMDKWRLNRGPLPASAFYEHLATRTCYAGLDLSSQLDLTALVLEFPAIPTDPYHYILPFFFCPEDNILQRARNDRVPYDVWADQGYLTPTPGAYVDQDFILERLARAMKQFRIKRLLFDRWGSTEIIRKLQDTHGFTVSVKEHEETRRPLLVEFGQGNVSMNAPMQDVMRLVLLNQYAHGDHPILTWNMDNLIAVAGPTGLIKPDKAKSREKIDGSVALIMAHAGAMTHNPDADRSVYSTRGLITI